MKNTPRNAVICLALGLITPIAAIAETPGDGLECTSLNARYTMEGADGFELRFEKSPKPPLFSDLNVVITSPKHRYVFEMWTTIGSPTIYFGVSDDVVFPEGSRRFAIYGFDANFKALEPKVPQSDTPAAQHYFTPDLSAFFHYRQPKREHLPQKMWHLTSCS